MHFHSVKQTNFYFIVYFKIILFSVSFYFKVLKICSSTMSASDYLKKAVEYDMNGRKLESLKLYQSGIAALLDICKSEFYSYQVIANQMAHVSPQWHYCCISIFHFSFYNFIKMNRMAIRKYISSEKLMST